MRIISKCADKMRSKSIKYPRLFKAGLKGTEVSGEEAVVNYLKVPRFFVLSYFVCFPPITYLVSIDNPSL